MDQSLKSVLAEHPCYDEEAHRRFARMHLPVAPRCNIQCNYCNRKYDCSNESRPGVTSEVLTPQQACDKVAFVYSQIPELRVIQDVEVDHLHEFDRALPVPELMAAHASGGLVAQGAYPADLLGVDGIALGIAYPDNADEFAVPLLDVGFLDQYGLEESPC